MLLIALTIYTPLSLYPSHDHVDSSGYIAHGTRGVLEFDFHLRVPFLCFPSSIHGLRMLFHCALHIGSLMISDESLNVSLAYHDLHVREMKLLVVSDVSAW